MNAKDFEAFRTRVVGKMKLASAQAIATSATFYICSRTCYIPGSARGNCTLCGHTVYFTDLKSSVVGYFENL